MVKAGLKMVPGLGVAIAGYEGYKQEEFNISLEKMLAYLNDKVDDPATLFNSEWLKTEEGELFSRKVVSCTLDAQLRDKQELFVNVLINGVNSKSMTQYERLKFADILRQLSRPAIDILAEMHKLYGPGGPKRVNDFPSIQKQVVTDELMEKFEPYLVESAIDEMRSLGLFGNRNWQKSGDGKWHGPTSYAEPAIAYTDFTVRFVQFIQEPKK